MIKKDEIEAGEFVRAINYLTPHGGGDCPELTFTGMLEALYQDPKWGSPMYVFTDAGPKDATDEMIEEVKHLASPEEYGVTMNFFTTGKESCSNLVPRSLLLWGGEMRDAGNEVGVVVEVDVIYQTRVTCTVLHPISKHLEGS